MLQGCQMAELPSKTQPLSFAVSWNKLPTFKLCTIDNRGRRDKKFTFILLFSPFKWMLLHFECRYRKSLALILLPRRRNKRISFEKQFSLFFLLPNKLVVVDTHLSIAFEVLLNHLSLRIFHFKPSWQIYFKNLL